MATAAADREANSRIRGRGRPIGAFLVCLALVLSACTAGPGTPASKQTPTDTSVLVTAVSSLGTQNYAPWLSSAENLIITGLVGDSLTRRNPKSYAIEPSLAESWQLSADLKTWTFKLRPNVPFQDGYGTVTAEDVRFSWEQYVQKDSIQFMKPQMIQAMNSDVKNVQVTGPLEFKVTSTKPVVNLPLLLSNDLLTMPIQSKKYFDAKPAEALKHPLGTGPYKFVSSTQGVEVVLEALPSHPFRQVPAFKKLVIKGIEDDAARLAQVRSGALDLALLGANLLGEARAAGLNIQVVPGIGSCSVTLGGYYPGTPALDRASPWVQADNPARGLAVRQAMSLAIDRKTILDKVMAGTGTLTHGPISEYPDNPNLVDPAWKLPAFDLAQAKTKLAEGGYPNGFPVTMQLFTQLGTRTADMGEAVAGMWEALGLKVTRANTEQANMRPKFQAANNPVGNSQTNGMSWVFCSPSQTSPELALPNAWMPIGNNKQAFSPAITDAYNKMSAEPDASKLYAVARGMISALIQDVHPLNLFTINQPWAAGEKIGSWTPTPGLDRFNSLETVTPKYK